jgi:hypothetical protein
LNTTTVESAVKAPVGNTQIEPVWIATSADEPADAAKSANRLIRRLQQIGYTVRAQPA